MAWGGNSPERPRTHTSTDNQFLTNLQSDDYSWFTLQMSILSARTHQISNTLDIAYSVGL